MVARHNSDISIVEHLVVQFDAHHGLGDLVQVSVQLRVSLAGNPFDLFHDHIQLRVRRFDMDISQHLVYCMPSDVFTESQPPAVPDHFRSHHAGFEGCSIFYNAVRMDATFVGEDIFTDNRLGGSNADTRSRETPARDVSTSRSFCMPVLTPYIASMIITVGKVGIACTFTEPVYGNLNLGSHLLRQRQSCLLRRGQSRYGSGRRSGS